MPLLNAASPTTTLAPTAGKSYAFAASGVFDGSILRLETNLPSTPTEWVMVKEMAAGDAFVYTAPGPGLRCTLSKPGGVSSSAAVNVETTLLS